MDDVVASYPDLLEFPTPSNGFTDDQYAASARLVAAICQRYAIPIDRSYLVGHNEVPDENDPNQLGGADHSTDPGPQWDWDRYLNLIRNPPA